MIPLTCQDEQLSTHPQFRIPRLFVSGEFEPVATPGNGLTAFGNALVDPGAPYVILPHKVHGSGLIRVHQDLGLQPYRLTSMRGAPLLQPFAEVGIRFLVRRPSPHYRPVQYARVKGYLLEKHVRPADRVVIGLDAMQTHFPLFVNGSRAFFLEPGESLTVP